MVILWGHIGGCSTSDNDDGLSGTTILIMDNIEYLDAQLEIETKGRFVDESIWNLCIQDTGCEERQLKAKTYS